MEKYETIDELGKGSYATVKMVRHRETGQLFALKLLEKLNNDRYLCSSLIRELSTFVSVSSPHVLKLHDVLFLDGDETTMMDYGLVMELCDRDLSGLIKRSPQPMTLETVKHFIYQILLGLRALHARGVMHRDIKPNNILFVRREQALKIADFGISRSVTLPLKPYENPSGCVHYRAPEVLLRSRFDQTKSDIWSAGVTLYNMLTGKMLFRGDEPRDVTQSIFSRLGTPTEMSFPLIEQLGGWDALQKFDPKPEQFWLEKCRGDKPSVDLLMAMLRIDYKERVSAEEALQLPLFDDVRARYEEWG